MLEPERAMQQRVILIRRTHFEPNAIEAPDRLQFRLGDVRIVVQEQTAVEGRPIDQEDRQQNKHQADRGEPPRPISSRKSRLAQM